MPGPSRQGSAWSWTSFFFSLDTAFERWVAASALVHLLSRISNQINQLQYFLDRYTNLSYAWF